MVAWNFTRCCKPYCDNSQVHSSPADTSDVLNLYTRFGTIVRMVLADCPIRVQAAQSEDFVHDADEKDGMSAC